MMVPWMKLTHETRVNPTRPIKWVKIKLKSVSFIHFLSFFLPRFTPHKSNTSLPARVYRGFHALSLSSTMAKPGRARRSPPSGSVSGSSSLSSSSRSSSRSRSRSRSFSSSSRSPSRSSKSRSRSPPPPRRKRYIHPSIQL